jgi:hypothetical protein
MDISDDKQQQQQNQIASKILLQTDLHKKTSYLSSYKNFYFALKSKEVKRQYPKL